MKNKVINNISNFLIDFLSKICSSFFCWNILNFWKSINNSFVLKLFPLFLIIVFNWINLWLITNPFSSKRKICSFASDSMISSFISNEYCLIRLLVSVFNFIWDSNLFFSWTSKLRWDSLNFSSLIFVALNCSDILLISSSKDNFSIKKLL